MRIFRTFASALGLAIAALSGFAASAFAGEHLAVQLYALTATGIGAEGAKFEAQLAQAFSVTADHQASVNADLVGEGQGYRQASAFDDYEGMAAETATS